MLKLLRRNTFSEVSDSESEDSVEDELDDESTSSISLGTLVARGR